MHDLLASSPRAAAAFLTFLVEHPTLTSAQLVMPPPRNANSDPAWLADMLVRAAAGAAGGGGGRRACEALASWLIGLLLAQVHSRKVGPPPGCALPS
jgi:hypothetical protein